ncbi:Gfo/Idh/MocA family oxidoreductase [Streptomyces avermitilis]|uniref:Gfo/Idh/MocA family oxidoreductase n=1 Tax=Streptomyces avermitilis TaxID=33903 RepID=UPI00380F58A4
MGISLLQLGEHFKYPRDGSDQTGFWAGYGHIPALRTLPEFEVVAVSARRKESAQQAAEKFGIPHAYEDAHDLIKDPDVDLVAVLPRPRSACRS